ncbi:hypothetical protein [Sphingomonas sp. ID0503]|uniref:hypothetical protein n=1 Tax=Sphingomonas sp. ID0503 TaxID=3399691 RepID=UPI003AFAC54A
MEDRDELVTIELAPKGRFQMQGIGYSHRSWSHGIHHGALAVEREDLDLASLDPNAGENIHVQEFAVATLTGADGAQVTGFGAFETTIVGQYAPLGVGTDRVLDASGRPPGLSW